MNNETNSSENNNLNGQVLGNINNSIPNGEVETLEMLDTSGVVPSNNNVETLENNIQSTSNVVNTSSVTPEPAYTNPQNINPMPGFEFSSTIGTTPPISLEPDKKPKKKKNKLFFIIIIIILLFGVGFGTFYVLKYTDLLSGKLNVNIETKNLELNLNDSLSTNINDYATVSGTDIKNCILDNSGVNSTVEGTYTYKVVCGNISKEGTINVIDNRELNVEIKNVYKRKGSTVDVKEFINNPVEGYVYEFVNSEEVNSILNGEFGDYTIKIKVTNGKKTKEFDAVLSVMEYDVIGTLTCRTKSQNLTDSSTTKVVEENFVILKDSDYSFSGITLENNIFKFVDETEYTNYVSEYKNNGVITIDNLSGNVKFDDSSKTITISKSILKEEIVKKFGEANMKNYRTIRTHFINTLKYACEFSKEAN